MVIFCITERSVGISLKLKKGRSTSGIKKSTDRGTRELYSEAVRQNIVKKDWVRLSEVMIGAELARIPKPLRKRGWYHVGLYEAERGNHPGAIIALNSARALDSTPEKTLMRMFEEMKAFCHDFTGKFSRQDLYLLTKSLERIASFHSFHSQVSAAAENEGKKLEQWIEDQLRSATDQVETPATHHVQRICAALFPPMTIEEVRAEFARIVEPLVRERLEQKAKPASGGGSKGPNSPKDPDEENPKPPEDKPISGGGQK